jgi:hypothetical protein
MKKILTILLVVVMVLGTFVSCIQEPLPSTPSVTEKPTDKVDQTEQNGGTGNQEPGGEVTPGGNENEGGDNVGGGSENEGGVGDSEVQPECNHEGGKDATCISESICDLCHEPYGGLDSGNHEGSKVWKTNDNTHILVYSCCDQEAGAEAKHNFVDGVCSLCDFKCAHKVNDGHSCTACGAFVAHNFKNSKCIECGLTRNGKKVTFGSYPQTKVTNSTIVSALNNKAGTPSTNEAAWSSYNYSENQNMWYADVEEGGVMYRGVYFTAYRPNTVTQAAGTGDNNVQLKNGYNTSKVYWFKYEPISWTIITEDTSAKKALVFCDMIIDAQAYDVDGNADYYDSSIRKWLNEVFLNTAFNEMQRGVILTSLVDNTDQLIADYPSGNNSTVKKGTDSEDKLFLLAKAELKNGTADKYNYLGNDYSFSETVRKKTPTDYAESQGAYSDEKYNSSNDTDSVAQGWWWTRTPSSEGNASKDGYYAHRIKPDGTFHNLKVCQTAAGVVPAMWINI